VSSYNVRLDRVIISPDGKSITISEMEEIFDRAGAVNETIFRRLEFNHVIQYTHGAGIDIGCGLNKIHSSAIGIDTRLGKNDFGYPFGANIKVPKNEEYIALPWFQDSSLDFVFSSHCLEHFSNPVKTLQNMLRVLRPYGYLVLILPDMRYYPERGQPGANPDHKWDCYPEMLLSMLQGLGKLEVAQLDTLHSSLEGVKLTPRDRSIAQRYGHSTLNFSFEGVFRKLE